jgi:hypothetical protein
LHSIHAPHNPPISKTRDGGKKKIGDQGRSFGECLKCTPGSTNPNCGVWYKLNQNIQLHSIHAPHNPPISKTRDGGKKKIGDQGRSCGECLKCAQGSTKPSCGVRYKLNQNIQLHSIHASHNPPISKTRDGGKKKIGDQSRSCEECLKCTPGSTNPSCGVWHKLNQNIQLHSINLLQKGADWRRVHRLHLYRMRGGEMKHVWR